MRGEWIKWWKDKTICEVIAIALGAVVVAALLACFISWGWILSLVVSITAGIAIRKIIIKRIEENL